MRLHMALGSMALLVAACAGDESNPAAPTVPSAPTSVTATFSGRMSGRLDGRDMTGALVTGSYVFNPAAVDTDPDPGVGVYVMPAPYGITVNLPDGRTLGGLTGLRIRVRNNVGGVEDDYEVQANPQPANAEVRLLLRSRNLDTLTTDALPPDPPDISRFEWGSIVELSVGSDSLLVVIDRLSR